MKTKVIILTIIMLLWASPSHGCVGARPLGMGGAFIGVADSIETVYWNPAGLTQIKEESIYLTLTLNHNDQMGYRSFIALNQNFGNIATGFSYITRLRSWDVLEEWYVISLATKITYDWSIGINGRYETHSNNFTDTQVDISSLWSITNCFKLGFLYQSLNNFRPGCSYKLNNNFIISVDIYNALHNKDILKGQDRIMWGIELKQTDFAIRIGEYAKDFTYGLSYKNINLTVMNRNDNIILLSFKSN